MRAGLLHATSNRAYKPHPWRGAGAVERGGLENRCASNRTEGSNPSLSANFPSHPAASVPSKVDFDPMTRTSLSPASTRWVSARK